MEVGFILETDIEAEANYLIKKYEAKHGSIQGYQIPVEEIAELQLGYHFEIMDLTKIYPDFEVNGFIDFDSQRIVVHSGLEPTENPNYVGRYNSTIAHECGHDVLHKPLVMAQLSTPDLFDSKPNQILCRTSDANERIEWQADCFASYLTMPKNKILQMWHDIFGSYKPILKSEIGNFRAITRLTTPEDSLVDITLKKFTREYVGVSSKTLRIRLEKLGLIVSAREELLV